MAAEATGAAQGALPAAVQDGANQAEALQAQGKDAEAALTDTLKAAGNLDDQAITTEVKGYPQHLRPFAMTDGAAVDRRRQETPATRSRGLLA